MSDGNESATTPAGWYPDPWSVAALRFWDGAEWTGHISTAKPSRIAESLPSWPRSRAAWSAFMLAALSGVAIWIPTNATHPRYSYRPHQDNGSASFFPVMIVAALLLGALFARHWRVIALGLVLPVLALAPFTTPRGDNDGLWILILPMLVVFGIVLHVVAGLSAWAATAISHRNRRWSVAKRQ